MNQHTVKPSELIVLQGSDTSYRFKEFLSGGKFPKVLLENVVDNQEVIGKFASELTEGEWKVWPKLHHENLNPLVEVMLFNKVKILISPVVGKYLRSVIFDIGFSQHPLCFERKKSYLKDVLQGLDYMHRNSFCVLNLTERNIKICPCSDKAVICDFSYAVNRTKIPRASLPSNADGYKPREVQKANSGDFLNGVAVDMWCCGFIFFRVFTQYLLLVGRDVYDSFQYVDSELLRRANGGAKLLKQTAPDLKKFFKNLLSPNPNFRSSANEALKSSFIRTVHNRLDEKARNFWKFAANSNSGIQLETSQTDSSVSEIDVSAISASKISVNGDLCSEDVSSDCKDRSFPVKTKSEPGTQRKYPNPKIRGRASLPFFFKQSRSAPSPEEINSSLKHSSSLASDLEKDSFEYDEEVDAMTQGSDSELWEYSLESFLTEWRQDDSFDDIHVFSNMSDSSLDEMSPSEIMSRDRLSTSYNTPQERDPYMGAGRKVPSKSLRSSCASERKAQCEDCNFGPPNKPPRLSLQKKTDCNVVDKKSVYSSGDPERDPYMGVRRKVPSKSLRSSCASERKARCEDCNFGPPNKPPQQKEMDCNVDGGKSVYSSTDSPPCLKSPSPDVRMYFSKTPQKSLSGNASWYPANEKSTETEDNIMPDVSELRGKKVDNPSCMSICERYSGVGGKSLANDAYVSPSIDSVEQLYFRRRWYHKFCLWCKCTSQRRGKC